MQKLLFLGLVLINILPEGFSQGKDSFFKQSSVKISSLSVNTAESEFGPLSIGDTLYFMAPDISSKNNKNKTEYYDLYKSFVDNRGKCLKPVLVEEIRSTYNDGPIAWCKKTGELFITQNYSDRTIKRIPFHDEKIRLKIIIAKRNKGVWVCVGEFPFYSPDYSVGHPAVTSSGDTLFFTSDMPGGYGESDLYYSIRKNGKWENPINLGSKINTSEKELFPFIADDQVNGSFLVFSSNGRTESKGFDLFYTQFPLNNSEVYRFKFPINTDYELNCWFVNSG